MVTRVLAIVVLSLVCATPALADDPSTSETSVAMDIGTPEQSLIEVYYEILGPACPPAKRVADAIVEQLKSAAIAPPPHDPVWVQIAFSNDDVTATIIPEVGGRQLFHASTCSELDTKVADTIADMVDPTAASRRLLKDHVTLHMRAVDSRSHEVRLVTATTWHYHKGHKVEDELTRTLCTTPCSADVPRGPLRLQIFDAAHYQLAEAQTTAAKDVSLDINYVSRAAVRRHNLHRVFVGAAIGFVIGYSGTALIANDAHAGSWHYYTVDPYVSLFTTVIGAGLAAIFGETRDADTVNITTHSQRE